VKESLLAKISSGLRPAADPAAQPRPRGDVASDLAIAVGGLFGAMAAVLTGGVGGPLAAWCLLPLVAAVLIGRADRLALGGAVSLAAVGVAALAGATLELSFPSPRTANLLGLIALATTALGFGAGLIILQARLGRDERRQRQIGAHLRQILDEQPHLLVAVTPTGLVTKSWGVEPRALAGELVVDRTLAALAVARDRPAIEAALVKALDKGAAEVGFAPLAAPRSWLRLTLRRLEATRLAGAIEDAEIQRDREAALDQARSDAESLNAGKSRFLANMSHELRTPLNAIMGFSDIMRQRLFGPLSDRYGEYAELIHESGVHLLDLINDVLDMSKIEAERFELSREEFDAREAVSGVLRLMRGQADRAGVQLRGLSPKEALDVVADRRALKQIVLNLISNALKFTPRGGGVTVTTATDGDVLELIVADTGVGIGEEDLQRLGRPYEQAGGVEQRAGGTGLGLSLVRSFAELHGGEMLIESRLGEGTTVTVRMPVLDKRPVPARTPEPAL
jgi:cell cycle sensor histidine kinase DivJ